MKPCLLCPDCDESTVIEQSVNHKEKDIVIHTAFCDFCEKPLYHIEGSETLELTTGLKAKPVDYDI